LFGQKSLKSESNGQNYLWRNLEVVRTIGSSEVATRLRVGRTHHPSIKNKHDSLISSQPMSLDCIINSGFWNLEARPNFLVCVKFQVCEEQGRKSKLLDPSYGRTVGSELPISIASREIGV
jgi:hypothetical protein